MPRLPFLALLLLAPAACSPSADDAGQGAPAESAAPASAATTASASATASASSAKGVAVKESTDLYEFEYAYPAVAASIPGLAAELEADAAKHKADLIKEAKAAKAESADGSFPYHAHSFGETWKQVADLPGYLSLSGDFYTFSGGAHGMSGMDSLVWDKARGKRLDGGSMFTSPASLTKALGPALCEALNAERTKRRGRPVDPAGGNYGFDDCHGADEATVLVGSSNGQTFDRLTLYFGPYVAGPYAEGAYQIDMPVTPAVLAAVQPSYRDAFSVKR